jgi:hypothetical protein
VLSLQPCSESVPRREEHKRKAKIRKSKLCPWPGSRFAVSSDRRPDHCHALTYPRCEVSAVRASALFHLSPTSSFGGSKQELYLQALYLQYNQQDRSRKTFRFPRCGSARRQPTRIAANPCTWSASDIFRTTCTAMAQRSASVRTLPPVRAIIQESATGFGRTDLPSRMQTWT